MSKRIALMLVLTIAPLGAIACSYSGPPGKPNPKRIFSESSNLVIAYPIGISNIPRAANDPMYQGTFRQTILWKVVVTWKGKYQPGAQFTTRTKLTRAMCTPGAGLYTDKPLILAFSGSEPFAYFEDYGVESQPEIFQYFQKALVKSGT